MQTYDFIPNDTIFCRDQRPLQAGFSFGRGANWPLPTVLHSAIRTALLADSQNGLPDRRMTRDGSLRLGRPHGKCVTTDYQWLNLIGPFPVDEKGITYFPIPRDLIPITIQNEHTSEKRAIRLSLIPNTHGFNNLPKPLRYLAVSDAEPSKDTLADWVSLDFYKDYLGNNHKLNEPKRVHLWESEYRIGVAIDDETLTTVEGQFYAGEHLRVRDGVKLRFEISEDPHKRELVDLEGLLLQLGGERRFGTVWKSEHPLTLPSAIVSGRFVKWILLTPAIFINGWLPGWIDKDSGAVKLRVVDKSKRADRRRPRREAGWRYDESNDPAPPIKATLVGAVIGKPQVVGGWDYQPKPTMLAVPSGSIYYFEAESDADAQRLASVLQGRCRSDFFGEKGLGLGVCGSWESQRKTSHDVSPVEHTAVSA